MPIPKPSIFEYINYREFLKDYYQWKKGITPSFSYTVFAKKVGFGAKSFLPHVIEGKRDLSRDSIFRVGEAIGLDADSLSYFEDLVAFNQCKVLKQKAHFFSRLGSHKKAIKAHTFQLAQLEFFSTWYHSTIRELVTLFDFDEDYSILARMVRPRITANQAKQSVNLLLELGMIRKDGSRYAQSNLAVTTGDEVRSLVVQKYHSQNLNLAEVALEKTPSMERDISSLVVGLSKGGFETVKSHIRKFRKELIDIVERDARASRVYHIGFQLFPTSESAE
ncbi:MAG: hypothetical protein JWP91_198 [Fibrobacteres bacterium]|nr:hypothetical protein [Fibrobacterota bacterium]